MGGSCWRIWASVLRFQIARAIPPRAAEVASNKPVRQIFRCSGVRPLQPGPSSIGTGSVLNGENLRKGTMTLKKNEEK